MHRVARHLPLDSAARGAFELLRDSAHPMSSARDVLELLHEGHGPHLLAEPGCD